MEPIHLPWKATKDGVPEKSGKLNYEQIPCLVIHDGCITVLCWNCEDECWDDEEGDDYECDADEVDYYIPLSDINTPQP